MGKLTFDITMSLDGFVAGPNGDMEWLHIDDEIWDDVTPVIDSADTGVYGRVTYELMAAYWPTAADASDATPHDIHHSRWANGATKLVFRKSSRPFRGATRLQLRWSGTTL